MASRVLVAVLSLMACSVGNSFDLKGLRARRLALYRIVGYLPRTQVTDFAALDVDQARMEEELFLGKMNQAKNVYTEGGNSGSYANLTISVPNGVTGSYPRGSEVLGFSASGGEVSGQLINDLYLGPNTTTNVNGTTNVPILVRYRTSNIQAAHVGCTVGGLFTFHDATLGGCFNNSGLVKIIEIGQDASTAPTFAYAYRIRMDNRNSRTLQKLSTLAPNLMTMRGNCSLCPFIEDFQRYVDYYGVPDYADKWIMAAFQNATTDFASEGRGLANFHRFTYASGHAEAISKGTVLLSLYMSVIGYMEDAIADCEQQCAVDACNDGPHNSLDVSVAYYAGSLEGEDGSGSGKLLYAFADVMAEQFRTAGQQGDDTMGTSFINYQVIDEFRRMQDRFIEKDCAAARANKVRIANYMKVPVIQGLLRVAHLRKTEDRIDPEITEQLEAEGATYAANLLPYLHKCSVLDARTVFQHMKVGSKADEIDIPAIRAALEKNYDCLGVTCEQVGGLYTVNGYVEDLAPCGTSAGPSPSQGGIIALSVVIGVFGTVLLAYLSLRLRSLRRRRKSQDSYRRSGNIAAVSEIS